MSEKTPHCTCGGGEPSGPAALVYPCSGAADVGEIADRAGRLLDAEGRVWMSCLAGIGGRVSGLLASAAAAPAVVAIDGCPQDCARKTLELAGCTGIRHVRVTDLGFQKGRSPAGAESVRAVAGAVLALV